MQSDFPPPRRIGTVIHILLLLLPGATGIWFFFQATQETAGVDFLLDMLIALTLVAPLPLILYRFYSLSTALYILQRDGLMIRWGLRREDIPLQDIQWIRPAKELGFRLPLPWLRWPGAILGRRKVQELGIVEFMSTDIQHMILVATPEKIFAISPNEINQFIKVFRRINELGSLSPLTAQSVYPTILLGRIWGDRLARLLILAGLGAGLIVLAVVSIAIPGRETIVWSAPNITAPAERLLLLPVLNGLIWLGNLTVGIFFFRAGKQRRIAAYILWGSAVLSSLLLLAGALNLIF